MNRSSCCERQVRQPYCSLLSSLGPSDARNMLTNTSSNELCQHDLWHMTLEVAGAAFLAARLFVHASQIRLRRPGQSTNLLLGNQMRRIQIRIQCTFRSMAIEKVDEEVPCLHGPMPCRDLAHSSSGPGRLDMV